MNRRKPNSELDDEQAAPPEDAQPSAWRNRVHTLRNWVLRVAPIVLIVGCLGALAYSAHHQQLLTLKAVNVTGLKETPKTDVLAVADLATGRQLLALAPGKVRQRIKTLPWVKEVEVKRHWPDELDITVVEREASLLTCVVGDTERCWLVDADGVPFYATTSANNTRWPVVHVSAASAQQGTERALDILSMWRVAIPDEPIAEMEMGQRSTVMVVGSPAVIVRFEQTVDRASIRRLNRTFAISKHRPRAVRVNDKKVVVGFGRYEKPSVRAKSGLPSLPRAR